MGAGQTLITSVGDFSFEQAKERNFYACPASYGWKKCDYIAFYRGKPVSAVTHFAKIKNISEDGDPLTRADRIRMFPDRMDETAVVYEIGDLEKLESPVECAGGHAVQGAMYEDLETLKSADAVTDLMEGGADETA